MEYFDPSTIMSKKMLKDNYFKRIKNSLINRIPKDIGDMLIKENNDSDNILIYHRTSRVEAEEIFENGLLIAGGNDLEYTTSRNSSDLSLLININGAAGYKNYGSTSSRVIIMKIPKTAIEYEPGITKPILVETNNIAEQGGGTAVIQGETQTYLLPEYVLGSIEYENGEIIEFVNNPNYREVHNYENNGLVCTSEAIYSCIEKRNGEFEGIDNKEKQKRANKLIIEQNNKYMIHPEKYHMVQENKPRSEEEIKEYSLKDLVLSKLKESFGKIIKMFDLDKENDER